MDPLRYLPRRGNVQAEGRSAGLRPVASALLCRPDGAVLLQHRDDDPTILDAGRWSLFGGGIEPGEDPDEALLRELHEEIGTRPSDFEPFLSFSGARAYYNVYLVRLDVPLDALTLGEGQGMDYLQPDVALRTLDLASSARVALEMLLAYRRFRTREGLDLAD